MSSHLQTASSGKVDSEARQQYLRTVCIFVYCSDMPQIWVIVEGGARGQDKGDLEIIGMSEIVHECVEI